MEDVLFILITAVFFAIAVGFVRICERIIGPDAEPTSTTPATPGPAALEVIEPESPDDSTGPTGPAVPVGSVAP